MHNVILTTTPDSTKKLKQLQENSYNKSLIFPLDTTTLFYSEMTTCFGLKKTIMRPPLQKL